MTARQVTTLPDLVVFDFDGVILDSAGIKTQGFADLFADRTEHVDAIVALHHRYGGYSRYRQFEMIYREILDEPLDDATSRTLGARYSELCLDRVLQADAIPGALEFLERHSAELPCWVASGSPHDELVLTIHRRDLAGYFRGVRGSPTTKPQTITEALATHAADPNRTVLVGDARSDLDAAQQGGIRFIGIVAPGLADPFPAGTLTRPDLTDLEATLTGLGI